MSVNPYEETERLAVAGAGASGREVESWALLELAKRLDRARKEQEQGQGQKKKQEQEKDASTHASALSEVVRLNWRAWTIIQSSLLDESNPLSPELRGDLLTLCAFIDKHSTQLLSSPSAEKVQILIDINMHLGQGLRGERLSEAEQKAILQARTSQVSASQASASQASASQVSASQASVSQASVSQASASQAHASAAPTSAAKEEETAQGEASGQNFVRNDAEEDKRSEEGVSASEASSSPIRQEGGAAARDRNCHRSLEARGEDEARGERRGERREARSRNGV